MNSEQNGFEDGVARVAGLSERQREVLSMIAAGRTNAEIAEALGLTFWGARTSNGTAPCPGRVL